MPEISTTPSTVDHIGVIVRSVESAKEFLGGVLGLPLVKETNLAGRGTRAAFFRCGNCEIEVIEVFQEEARRARLGDNEARIEHIAVQVPSLEAILAHLGDLGGQMDAAPLHHDGDLMSFSVPATTMGVRFQFIEKNVQPSTEITE